MGCVNDKFNKTPVERKSSALRKTKDQNLDMGIQKLLFVSRKFDRDYFMAAVFVFSLIMITSVFISILIVIITCTEDKATITDLAQESPPQDSPDELHSTQQSF